MFHKVIPVLPFVFLLLNLFSRIHCEENIGISLSCVSESESLKYEIFETNFYFSSRKQKHQLFTLETFDSGKIDFDPKRRTVVLVHGLAPEGYMELMDNLRDAFLEWENVNIIYADWGKGCPSPLKYQQSARNTEYAAIRIRRFIESLIEKWEGTDKSVDKWGPLHFIGLSLGAHVAGQAAELLRQGDEPLVYRVTGLDPAEPCFDNVDSTLRMKKSNARFVDVIHTDVARTLNAGFGLLEPIGHADFYVNGGSDQPGCGWFGFRKRRKGLNYTRLAFHLSLEKGKCHHLRASHLFTESLKQAVSKQCTFWAHPWDSESVFKKAPFREVDECDKSKCIEMGINAELYNHSTNVYYVPTIGAPPYCVA